MGLNGKNLYAKAIVIDKLPVKRCNFHPNLSFLEKVIDIGRNNRGGTIFPSCLKLQLPLELELMICWKPGGFDGKTQEKIFEIQI